MMIEDNTSVASNNVASRSVASRSMASKSVHTPSDIGSTGGDNATMFESSNDSGITPPLPTHIYHAPEVAKKEDTFIKRAKVLVAAALLVAVIAVAVSTYLLVSNQEQEGFENQVRVFGKRQLVPAKQSNPFDCIPVHWPCIGSCHCSTSKGRNIV